MNEEVIYLPTSTFPYPLFQCPHCLSPFFTSFLHGAYRCANQDCLAQLFLSDLVLFPNNSLDIPHHKEFEIPF